ncbi:MAG TPA: choice-of-anchor D domain-containing protein, partial [Candidatus Binatia bacterium]|nr:choice-of-anchor D domain-containing protein [Candidatus Binatia bacterium]
PSSIATAQFTGDKTRSDLAITDGGAVSILLGNGDGTFQQPVSYIADDAEWVTAQDLNSDGKLDLAVANSGNFPAAPAAGVDVLYGNGDGTFQPEVVYPIPGRVTAYYVAASDLNNDGKPDLAVVDFLRQHVFTLLNTGAATFSPTTPLSFEKQLLGTTSTPMSTKITNSGTSDMTFSSVECSGAPFRMTGNTCTGSLAPGAQCSITADFTAKATGLASGTITIHDSASSKPQFIQLVGQGTSLGISPDKLEFPAEKVGAQSQPRTLHLTNVGRTTITFTHPVGVFGTDNQDFPQSNDCGLSLAANASCTVTITFAPQHKGERSAYVEMEDNSGDSPQHVPLSGRGE